MGIRMARDLPAVYLARHGETAWSASGQHTGRTDIPLTERGERDARALRARLTGIDFALVLTSPLERARRTAEPRRLRLGAPGARSDGMGLRGVRRPAHGGHPPRTTRVAPVRGRLPRGETAAVAAVRADRVIARLRATAADALVFAHRDILRVLAVRWLDLAAVEGRRLYLETSSLSILGYHHDLDEPVIRLWNEICAPGRTPGVRQTRPDPGAPASGRG